MGRSLSALPELTPPPLFGVHIRTLAHNGVVFLDELTEARAGRAIAGPLGTGTGRGGAEADCGGTLRRGVGRARSP